MKTNEFAVYLFFGAFVTFTLSSSFNNTLKCYADGKELLNNQALEVTAVSDKIEWETSFAKGLKIAKKANKPIMIDFYAEWCGWCKKLDNITYKDKEIIELSRQYVCIKVNTDLDKVSPKKYGVKGLPTIVFLTSDGKLSKQIVGYGDAEKFKGVMSVKE